MEDGGHHCHERPKRYLLARVHTASAADPPEAPSTVHNVSGTRQKPPEAPSTMHNVSGTRQKLPAMMHQLPCARHHAATLHSHAAACIIQRAPKQPLPPASCHAPCNKASATSGHATKQPLSPAMRHATEHPLPAAMQQSSRYHLPCAMQQSSRYLLPCAMQHAPTWRSHAAASTVGVTMSRGVTRTPSSAVSSSASCRRVLLVVLVTSRIGTPHRRAHATVAAAPGTACRRRWQQ
eukprot:363789-Chlamydomonas_euryale.AAC.7